MRRRPALQMLLACAVLLTLGACDPDAPDASADPTESAQPETSEQTPESATDPTVPAVAATADDQPNAAPMTPPSAEEGAEGSTAESPPTRAGGTDASQSSSDCGLTVTRIVLASEIVEREPVALDQATVSSTPVFVFAEVDNTDGPEQTVQMVWSHPATEHEHRASLDIGISPTWRTWAQHRLIRGGPGAWTVRLETADGCVAGRLEFVAR